MYDGQVYNTMQTFVKIGHIRYHVFRFLKIATVHNLGFSNFLIYNFLVIDLVRTTDVHRHTNFIKIGQMDAEISHLTTVKMMAVCQFGFLKI